MKIRLLVALTVLTIGFAGLSPAQQNVTVDQKVVEQIRALAMRYTEAYNKHDPAGVAALFAEHGIRVGSHGTFYGRPAIERAIAKFDFQMWHTCDLFKRIDRVIAVGNEIRAHGIWSCTYQDTGYAEIGPNTQDEGHLSWVLVREGDTWKIARETTSESNFHATTGD
jgi:uncharacterized protein (TIGR02246 family)